MRPRRGPAPAPPRQFPPRNGAASHEWSRAALFYTQNTQYKQTGETKAGTNTPHARRRAERGDRARTRCCPPLFGVLCKERPQVPPARRAAVTYSRWDHHLSQTGPVLQEDDAGTCLCLSWAAQLLGQGQARGSKRRPRWGFSRDPVSQPSSAGAEGKHIPCTAPGN